MHEVLAPDDEDALGAITVGLRMFQNVEQAAALDVRSSNPMSRSALGFAFSASSQSKGSSAQKTQEMLAE